MNELKFYTFQDIAEYYNNLTPEQAKIEMELSYRRGYRDGWEKATSFLWSIFWMRKKELIYDAMYDYWEKLYKWVNRNSCNSLIYPPQAIVKCVYCGKPAEQMDHVIPKSRGGSNELNNLVPSCKRCNYSKSNKPLDEWLRERES